MSTKLYKFYLAAIPKDKKKGGTVCKNDSGSGLIIKRGNRFVQIGRCFELKKNIGHLFIKGIVSGSKGISKQFKWPSHVCIKENEPDFFSNVGAYAKDIWEIIKKDGGVECQTEVKV